MTLLGHNLGFSPRRSWWICSNEKPKKSISVDLSLPLKVELLNWSFFAKMISDAWMGAHRHSSTSPHYPTNGGFSPNSLSITEKAISTKHVHKGSRRCQENAFTRAEMLAEGRKAFVWKVKQKARKVKASSSTHAFCSIFTAENITIHLGMTRRTIQDIFTGWFMDPRPKSSFSPFTRLSVSTWPKCERLLIFRMLSQKSAFSPTRNYL